MNDYTEEQGSLILGRFRKLRIIEKGQRYTKYLLRDVYGGERGEIKVQVQGERKPTVLHEAGFLQEMQGYPGFPLMIWSGNHNNSEMAVIIQKLGPSLAQLLPKDRKSFNLTTACLVGQQIIKLIEILHDKHAVLGDFSPQNFKVDPKAVDKIIIGSLLNCRRYRSSRTLKHYKVKEVQYGEFINHFVSLNRLVNMSTSRRDDLESFLFLMSFLIKGKLPWSHVSLKNIQKAQENLFTIIEPLFTQQKSKVKDQLLQGLPKEFVTIFEHIRSLQFEQRPDYCLIRMKLKRIILRLSKQVEPKFQWISKLSNLKYQGFNPGQIDLYTDKDKKILKEYYLPSQDKIELDKIDSMNGYSPYKQKIYNKKIKKRKGTCSIM